MGEWNLKSLVDQLLFFLSQSVGITLPRVAAGVIGLSLVFIACMRFWERKWKILPVIISLAFGGLLVLFALNTEFLHALFALSFLSRIRLMLGVLSVLVFSITFESIRISRLKERYAFLWLATSFMVLLSALFPQIIELITVNLGVQYVTAIVGVVFTFLLLVAFHFSIALSGLEEDRAKIAQKCALLDLRLTSLEQAVFKEKPSLSPKLSPQPLAPLAPQHSEEKHHSDKPPLNISGGKAAAWSVIGITWLIVLWVGLQVNEPMIGDEVTHYYMLTHQAENLPQPTYQSYIPAEFSELPEVRHYPHVNGWHYLGGWLFRIFPNHFSVVQLYHSLFFLQLLWFCYCWSAHRRGKEAYSPFLFVLLIATLPMNLFFGTAFYQDVPLAAQAVAAFYFLDRRKFGLAGLFLAFAMCVKVTGVLFVPFFFTVAGFIALETSKKVKGWLRKLFSVSYRLAIPLIMCAFAFWLNTVSLSTFGNAQYLPEARLREIVQKVLPSQSRPATGPSTPAAPPTGKAPPQEAFSYPQYQIVANHPGDLRNPINILIYGGGAVWLVLVTGVIGLIRPRGPTIMKEGSRKHAWPLLVGIGYLSLVGMLTASAPDIRFFLPGVPFILLPLSEWSMRLPKIKFLLIILSVVGVLQSGFVLRKFSEMRSVSNDLRDGIRYLEEAPPTPQRVFMYPEGNYRLFPVEHDWYMDYAIQDLWSMTEEQQLALFDRRNIGGVVVKKRLIGPVVDPRRDLGSYPPEFVERLRNSSFYEKVFENDDLVIFYIRESTS